MNGVDVFAIIANACGLGGAITGIAITVSLPRQSAEWAHAAALVALLAILGADMASSIFDLSPMAGDYPGLVWASLLLWPWIPVCLWMYVDGLIGDPPQTAFCRRYCLIATAGTICILPFLTLPAAARLELVKGTIASPAPHLLLALAGVPVFFLIWIGSMLVVGVKTVRALARHRRKMRELLSDVSAVDLRWIDGFMLFIGAGMIVIIADNIVALATGADLMNMSVSAMFEACLIVGLAVFGVRQHRVVPGWAGEPDIVDSAPQVMPTEPRYARSSLTAEDCAAIVARLDAVMRSDEPWRNPFLNLKALSEKIATRPYYVTQALNTACERNFYDYVNGWRVRAAADALLRGEATVLSICEDVGFNSKSTFNAMFRKEMGSTPTAYRRAHRAKNAS